MATLPSTGSFLAGAGTRSSRGVLLEDWLLWSRQQAGGNGFQSHTISAGAITPTYHLLIVDTEGAAAGDDLDRINATNYQDGQVVTIRAADAGRAVRVRSNQGGAGQIWLATSEITLTDFQMGLWLAYDAANTRWVELARHYGPNLSAARSALGLTGPATATFATAGEIQTRTAHDKVVAPDNLVTAFDYYPLVMGDRTLSTELDPTGELVYAEHVDSNLLLRKISVADFLAASFVAHYYSGELTCALGDSGTLTHSLGARPSLWRCSLICKTTELGWAVNDEVDVDGVSPSGNTRGLTVAVNATQIKYKICDANQIAIVNFSNGDYTAITPANWRLIIRAWR